MKNGSQPGKPVMSARPPMPGARSTQEVLDDLDRVKAITEVPARIAAESLDPEGVSGVESVTHEVEPVAVPERPRGKKTEMPWETLGEEGKVSFNFKLPTRLAAKLKYLGDTTYGESMTSIVAEALNTKVEKMLKERKLF